MCVVAVVPSSISDLDDSSLSTQFITKWDCGIGMKSLFAPLILATEHLLKHFKLSQYANELRLDKGQGLYIFPSIELYVWSFMHDSLYICPQGCSVPLI